MNDKKEVFDLLKANVVPALGCTDPITPALAAAMAYSSVKGPLQSIRLTVSNDVYKNSDGVILPGTKESGLPFAVMFGITAGNPDKGLMLLEDYTEQQIGEARKLLGQIPVSIEVDPHKGEVYVHAAVTTGNGSATVVFDGHHENPVYIEKDGQVLLDHPPETRTGYGNKLAFFDDCSIGKLYDFADSAKAEDLEFLRQGIEMNKKVADAGKEGHLGISTGFLLSKIFSLDVCKHPYFKVKSQSSAAGDARMGGGTLPVMSVFGSGNQGVVIFNGLSALKEEYSAGDEVLLKALCLSCLIAGYSNKLLEAGTPFCDCAIVAAVSLAGGLSYMLGGDQAAVEKASQMTLQTLAGVLCDGAKPNCAQKISLGVGIAVENAQMSLEMKGDIPKDGILGNSFGETVKNMALIGSRVRTLVEGDIVQILKDKKSAAPTP
ncbi:MAG: L-serine ammonia-lyase, iron-sulfur-dependent, subunit alpha [Clostridiales bacterium]|nr:L-serine ammonia-lyase, iron-sulfur-dependent, subunit alpha [Clostridiales bacterium]